MTRKAPGDIRSESGFAETSAIMARIITTDIIATNTSVATTEGVHFPFNAANAAFL